MSAAKIRLGLVCALAHTLWGSTMGCAKGVFGAISPTLFQFHPVVPYVGPGAGGWKVAQVLVLLGKLSISFPAVATCDVEVGVPEVNYRGVVSDGFAQVAVAAAADQAARKVLQQGPPTALACQKFREEMEAVLTHREYGQIPGAKITGFRTPNIIPTKFP